ncbi:MAG: hypothetical protein CM15mP39_11860 [Synechococcus sp.]|nr:MAG: hypothetical protein CM15mP39_11860 [Synechococcus sp.]
MNQPENASYVEMMRCWSLTGWNYEIFKTRGPLQVHQWNR